MARSTISAIVMLVVMGGIGMLASKLLHSEPDVASGRHPASLVGQGMPGRARLTFNQDVLPILEKRCSECHSRNFYDADPSIGCSGMITFENTPLGSEHYGGPQTGQSTGCPNRSLYRRLTELRSWGCYSKKYVQAGEPASSFLLMKIRAEACDGVHTTPPPVDMPEEEVRVIERWIQNGAIEK